jgi:hypothetical protein
VATLHSLDNHHSILLIKQVELVVGISDEVLSVLSGLQMWGSRKYKAHGPIQPLLHLFDRVS